MLKQENYYHRARIKIHLTIILTYATAENRARSQIMLHILKIFFEEDH